MTNEDMVNKLDQILDDLQEIQDVIGVRALDDPDNWEETSDDIDFAMEYVGKVMDTLEGDD